MSQFLLHPLSILLGKKLRVRKAKFSPALEELLGRTSSLSREHWGPREAKRPAGVKTMELQETSKA